MSFTIIPPAPAITDFNPRSGTVGDAIAIAGTSFTPCTSVKFNGVPATFTVDSDTQITATVPTGCSSGLIEIATGGGIVSSSTGFTVTIPNSGGGGGVSAIAIFDEGTQLSAAAASINFVGAGVTTSNEGNAIKVNISGGGEAGGSSFAPTIKTTNYTAIAGDVLIADSNAGSWELTLPSNPTVGDSPIKIFGGSDFSINPLLINLGNSKYQRSSPLSQKLVTKTNFSSFELIFAGNQIGWIANPCNVLTEYFPDRIKDTFTDNNKTLSLHIPKAGGAWSTSSDSWQIVDNAAYFSGAVAGNGAFALSDAGASNVSLTCDILFFNKGVNSQQGVIIRADDFQNCWVFRYVYATGQLTLEEITGGSGVGRASKNYQIPSNTIHSMGLRASGTTIIGSIDGADQLTYNSSVRQSSTLCGLWVYEASAPSGAKWDNLLVI